MAIVTVWIKEKRTMNYKDEMRIDNFTWNYMINAGFREVGEDEIVIKKSEYENLTKTYAAINSEAYYCGLSVGREEVAKEILQELYDEAISYVCKVVELTTFQIEQRAKEKGIELEKDNGQRRNI